MAFPLYLAMTAAERSVCAPTEHLCYMACHFSAYGKGLSNLPASLPSDSILMLNDRMPPLHHDPVLVADQLAQTAEAVNAGAIILDLQRPDNDQTREIISHILKTQTRPVAVSDSYAKDFSCDVFLSAPPLHTPLQQALRPWRQRGIYLEIATEPEDLLLTEGGCISRDGDTPEEAGFFDAKLCCHYRMQLQENAVRFSLWRTKEDLQRYLQQAEQLGVLSAIGLYQQLYPLLAL